MILCNTQHGVLYRGAREWEPGDHRRPGQRQEAAFLFFETKYNKSCFYSIYYYYLLNTLHFSKYQIAICYIPYFMSRFYVGYRTGAC